MRHTSRVLRVCRRWARPLSATRFTASGKRALVSLLLLACCSFVGACSDSSGPSAGPLASLVVRSGDGQTALAGTTLPTPIVVVPTDAQGHAIPGEAATFAVIAGGGSLSSASGQAGADGTLTAPAWTLGTSAVPQQLQVTAEGKTTTINASVQTQYAIEIRFFGHALSASQQALFTNAVARLRAVVVGGVPPVDATGADPANCLVTGAAPLAETINGVLIYASIDSIDGPRKILAEAGPCYIRVSNGQSDFRTSIGVMKFDSADIASLAASGNLQEVITHEMLHVLGFGTFWDSTAKNLLINAGLPSVSYVGAGGAAGCRSIGGNITCASTVPVEGSEGGDGTLNGHWRESTFANELMTGFINSGTNPLSAMTIRSLEDLGYTVDAAAADPYGIPGGSLRASGDVVAPVASGSWERPILLSQRPLPTLGLPAIYGSK